MERRLRFHWRPYENKRPQGAQQLASAKREQNSQQQANEVSETARPRQRPKPQANEVSETARPRQRPKQQASVSEHRTYRTRFNPFSAATRYASAIVG
jgi:hypothetical protein